jgi:DNA-binding response OmpR family regulator
MRLAEIAEQNITSATQPTRIVVVGSAGDDLSAVLTLLRDAGHQIAHYDPSVPILALEPRGVAGRIVFDEAAPQVEVVVGEFALDQTERVLRFGMRSMALAPRQFLVMRALMRSPHRALTREELCNEAGIRSTKSAAGGRSLDMQILHLRKFIESDTTQPRHILTVRQVGYRFVPVAPPAIALYPRRIAQPA